MCLHRPVTKKRLTINRFELAQARSRAREVISAFKQTLGRCSTCCSRVQPWWVKFAMWGTLHPLSWGLWKPQNFHHRSPDKVLAIQIYELAA